MSHLALIIKELIFKILNMKPVIFTALCVTLSLFCAAQPCEFGVAGYRFIDFDNLCEGQVVTGTTVFDVNDNIHFSTFNSLGESHPLVAFNSAMPTGNDDDLISPGPNCNVNNCPMNWHPQESGADLGMILIMETSSSQTNTCNNTTAEEDPNDWAIPSGATGTIRIDFDVPHNIGSLGFLDDIDIDLRAYRNGSVVFSTSASSANENEYLIIYLLNLLEIDRLEIDFNGSGALTHLEVCEQSGIMPLELTDFQAEAAGNHVILSWETQSELASEYFEVQRSFDGSSFETFSSNPAMGSPEVGHSYQIEDVVANHAELLYYRILQHNTDGSIDVSGIRSVQIGTTQGELRIYPNPSRNAIRLSYPGDANELLIYTLQGQLIRTVSNLDPSQHVDIRDLARGFYLLEIKGAKARHHIKLQKL